MILDQYDRAVRIFLQDRFYPNQTQIIAKGFVLDQCIPVVELDVKQ